jgi:peptidoglycan/LPS O-acetylase OafA/YrhL
VFLMHYPVMLAVGALVGTFWPDSVPANGLGMVSAWGLALAAAALLHRLIEAPRTGSTPAQAGASAH